MDYPRQVSLRISEDQYAHCLTRGGVSRHIRRLLAIDMGAGVNEVERIVAEIIKKYAPEKGV